MKAFVAEADWNPRKEYTLTPGEAAGRRAIVGSQVWQNPRFEIKDVMTPSVREDELLIKVASCGICGSDTHTYEADSEGYIIFSGLAQLPCTLGHEFTGEVVEAGSNAAGFRKGDIVTSESVLWCGTCLPCRSGMPNQCENVELMGLSSDGAFAEFIAVKAKYCWKLNSLEKQFDRKDIYRLGALIEPIGCAYNGMFISGGGFLPGSCVIVYGAGPIGLGAVLLARIAGASRIIAVDVIPERLEIARKLGADFVLDFRKEPSLSGVMKELTSGKGADIQVEAAGATHATLPLMQSLCAKRGKIITLGRVAAPAHVELNSVVSGAHAIIGSRGHSGYGIFPEIIRLMEGGRLDPVREMITTVLPFSRIVEGFELSSRRTDAKILIEMGE